MEYIDTPARTAPRGAATAARATIHVDCIDAPHRDLLVYWLNEAGYAVRKGPPAIDGDSAHAGAAILLTDRFGPGRHADATILQLKERQPDLRVVVIGAGGDTEPAQLSLARAAGADATVPAAFDRESIMRLLHRWR